MRFWSQAWTTNEMKNNIKNDVSWAQNDTKLSCAKAKKRLHDEIAEEKPLETTKQRRPLNECWAVESSVRVVASPTRSSP